jgi:Putative phage tail protein
MSGLRSLFGGGNQPATPVSYTGMQIQTAVNTLPVPLVWGQARLAPNVIWYNNFVTHQGGGGKSSGKGGIFSTGASSVSYTYTADVMLALCEGPISNINVIWKDQSVYSLASLGLSLFAGTTPQGVWSYLASSDPGQALAYQGTAYLAAAGYQLSSAATLDNHNFEVQGLRWGSGYGQTSYATYVSEIYDSVIIGNATNSTNAPLPWNGAAPPTGYFDADPALIINDFLTSAQFGIGFPSGSIDSSALFTRGGSNDSSYQSYCRAVGLALSPALIDQEQASSVLQRWLQLTNTAAVWSGGLLRFIPYGDTVISANGVTFTPNVTPIYDLGDDDFMPQHGEDPLQVSRSDLFEAYNVWRLEVADRANEYTLTTVECRDQSTIERVAESTGTRGERIAPTVTAHEICDIAIASICGQLMLQRAVYIRNTYKFRLSWECCLLDPMDLVTVTDSILGLADAPIRITQIEEDENGYLSVTAEEFPLGVATAALYPTQSSTGNLLNRNAPALPVNAPLIFAPPASLAGSTPQVWVAASGGFDGAVDPNWGGCRVYVSLDGSTYTQVGQILTAAAQGILSSPVSSFAGTNPDLSDTLAVNLSESDGALANVPAAAAALGVLSLCMVDDELLSYETATLTSVNNYALTTLYRGLYGTTANPHVSGSSFCLLTNYVIYDLPSSYSGQVLFFKLQSFNQFGLGVQDLSACAVYPFGPAGNAAFVYPYLGF